MAEIERLLVREPFDRYNFGDRITDPEMVKEVRLTHPDHVLLERLVVEDRPGESTEDPAAGTVEPLQGQAAQVDETLRTAARTAEEVRREAPAAPERRPTASRSRPGR